MERFGLSSASQLHRESGASARRALDRHSTVHLLDQKLRDNKSQSCTRHVGRRRKTPEGLEQLTQLLRRDALPFVSSENPHVSLILAKNKRQSAAAAIELAA